MIAVFVATMACFVLVPVLDLLVGLSQAAAVVALGGLVVLVVCGVGVQLSERCPRCRYRLGLRSSLVVPPRCRGCGVALRGEASGE